MLDETPAFPKDFEPYRAAAQELLDHRAVKEVLFSRGTYQVQIDDGTGVCWVFLQCDEGNTLKDCFCDCDEEAVCVHMAAAYLYAIDGGKPPLHTRFALSLWCCLGRLCADECGWQHPALENTAPGRYVCLFGTSGEEAFSIEAHTPAIAGLLEHLIEERLMETEETSLKFSNWPAEEITLWREGRPSAALRYELSVWADLAKWLFVQQEAKVPYTVAFDYDEIGLPSAIKVAYQGIATVAIALSHEQLVEVIPYLRTIDSPLLVHSQEEERLKKISYDEGHRCLRITMAPPESGLPTTEDEAHRTFNTGRRLGRWIFVPGRGFFSMERHDLLERSTIPLEEIPKALEEHGETIKKYLTETLLYEEPSTLSYHLAFDGAWALHIEGYLFHRGDLLEEGAWQQGHWAYLHDDGFYRLTPPLFETPLKVIPSQEVDQFITQQRSWLALQEGFHTHLSSLDTKLSYAVDTAGALHFDTERESPDEPTAVQDFGEWLYIRGQGFYAKATWGRKTSIKAGMAVLPHEVPAFIRAHRDELECLPGFFSDRCPVIKAGLDISMKDSTTISIRPEYVFSPDCIGLEPRLYEHFVYIPGSGFYELPVPLRLPLRFSQPVDKRGEELEFFLTYELKGLQDVATHLDPRLAPLSVLNLSVSGVEQVEPGLLAVAFSYTSPRGSVDAYELWQASQQHRRYLFSDVGLIDLHEPPFVWLRQIPTRQVDKKKRLFKLSTLEFLRLTTTVQEGAEEGSGESPLQGAWEMLQQLPEFEAPPEPDMAGFDCSLRPYQEIGFRWLWFLYCNRLSGLLCDDMGLGKTHQAMALIAAIVNGAANKERPRFLIVCPTSVIYHWSDKLAKFLPGLKMSLFYGAGRSLEDFSEGGDLLITSYGVLRSERTRIAAIPFALAIYDEIQVAKNHHSQVHRALCDIHPTMALGLTGTPIENNLRELKSLFDIILPGYMPSEARFRDLFVLPIEREQSLQRRGLLGRWVKPFVLRRKKSEVLLELPEKTEEIAHCQLSPRQQAMYQYALSTARPTLVESLLDKEKEVPYVHIFSVLTRLKQICNHPAVFLKEPHNFNHYESGKWDLFCELLQEARESQQKVVVFSQYLDMLTIFELYLKQHDIGYALIRGDTANRPEQLRRFQEDPQCEVFIGSLQEVGLGVDLTAASVVIHYDRWWNAARENQATDRVHRIGQQRGVQVFKMVTKGTFEETIDRLISEKGQLMEEVVGSDAQYELKQFSRDDLLALLEIQ